MRHPAEHEFTAEDLFLETHLDEGNERYEHRQHYLCRDTR